MQYRFLILGQFISAVKIKNGMPIDFTIVNINQENEIRDFFARDASLDHYKSR